MTVIAKTADRHCKKILIRDSNSKRVATNLVAAPLRAQYGWRYFIASPKTEKDPINHAPSPHPFKLTQITCGKMRIEFGTLGDGPPVMLLPGRGGAGPEQFDGLGAALAAAGYRAIAINPRGVGLSNGPLEDLSLHNLADDVANVIDALGRPAHIVGRALGNRIARCCAADHPDHVKSLSLISAGGLVSPIARTNKQKLQPQKPVLNHWREAGLAHEHASKSTPLDEWWSGGNAPMLVVQGLDDHIAVPANGPRLAEAFPSRVRLREIPEVEHMLLFERPDLVIPVVLAFIREFEST